MLTKLLSLEVARATVCVEALDGYGCSPPEAERGVGGGSCKSLEVKKLAQPGEDCSFDLGCVEKDSEGRLVVCPQAVESRKCSSRFEDGESCATENAVCGGDVEVGQRKFCSDGAPECDGLRTASCDGGNVCRVTEDRTCKFDIDCDSTAGLNCVNVKGVTDLGSKACYNYNRQAGETCKTSSDFGSLWDLARVDGLFCKETSSGRFSVDGICVRLVSDGEQCILEEGIDCAGSTSFPQRSVCNSGTCRPI